MIFGKLTLRDLQLTKNQSASLRSLTRDQRDALFAAMTHVYLTSYKGEVRSAAKKLREYIRKLSLDKHNANPFDKTAIEKVKELWENDK